MVGLSGIGPVPEVLLGAGWWLEEPGSLVVVRVLVTVGVLVVWPIGAIGPLPLSTTPTPRCLAFPHPTARGDAQCEAPRRLASLTYVEAAVARPDVKGRVPVSNDFLAASAEAAARLQAAQRKHAAMKAKADRRLHAAQERHAADLADAAAVEAAGWRQLLGRSGDDCRHGCPHRRHQRVDRQPLAREGQGPVMHLTPRSLGLAAAAAFTGCTLFGILTSIDLVPSATAGTPSTATATTRRHHHGALASPDRSDGAATSRADANGHHGHRDPHHRADALCP